MGAVATTTYEITCDNPVCPGNELDPTSFTGWIQVTATIHANGDMPVMTTPSYFCSPDCAATIEQSLTVAKAKIANPDGPDTPETQPEETPAPKKTRAKKS